MSIARKAIDKFNTPSKPLFVVASVLVGIMAAICLFKLLFIDSKDYAVIGIVYAIVAVAILKFIWNHWFRKS